MGGGGVHSYSTAFKRVTNDHRFKYFWYQLFLSIFLNRNFDNLDIMQVIFYNIGCKIKSDTYFCDASTVEFSEITGI